MASRQYRFEKLYKVIPMNTNTQAIYAVDTNRSATAKQLYAVGNHFAKLYNPKEPRKLVKVFGAILMKFQTEHPKTPITMREISHFLEIKEIPAKFVSQVQAPKEWKKKAKPTPKVTASVKAKAAPKVKATPKATATVKPKASTQTTTDFEKRLKALQDKINKNSEQIQAHEKRLNTMDTKLDMLMAFIETNPELMY